MFIPTITFLAVIVLVLLMLISFYNRLVKLRNNRENAFADIDVQLKQRHDLIPQLVDTVKGYMNHEEKVLTNITAARAGALNASTINEKIVKPINIFDNNVCVSVFGRFSDNISKNTIIDSNTVTAKDILSP